MEVEPVRDELALSEILIYFKSNYRQVAALLLAAKRFPDGCK